MKELSIAGKATRYDEALKEAVIAHKDEDRHLKATLERIFPELKESEDEKIRKEILDYIIKGSESLYDVQQYGKERFEKWIAWLEKQVEHAKFTNRIQVGDKVTRNEDGVLVNLSQLNRVAKKQGERKPAERSEEDEAMWSEISDLLWEGYKQSGSKFSLDDIRNWVNPKLKSLRHQQNTWKPSDEQMNTLEYYMHTLICNEHKEVLFGLYADLKKLREE